MIINDKIFPDVATEEEEVQDYLVQVEEVLRITNLYEFNVSATSEEDARDVALNIYPYQNHESLDTETISTEVINLYLD